MPMDKFAALLTALMATPLAADPVMIVAADVTAEDEGWRVSVTLRHPDTGWDHFADAWEVQDSTGNPLARRDLAHPHVDEQPFTRALGGVIIPGELGTVRIVARCSVTGWSTAVFVLPVPRD